MVNTFMIRYHHQHAFVILQLADQSISIVFNDLDQCALPAAFPVGTSQSDLNPVAMKDHTHITHAKKQVSTTIFSKHKAKTVWMSRNNTFQYFKL